MWGAIDIGQGQILPNPRDHCDIGIYQRSAIRKVYNTELLRHFSPPHTAVTAEQSPHK